MDRNYLEIDSRTQTAGLEDDPMDGVYLLENSVQEYAWGSTTAIADLLGQPSPSPVPQAELWMGAHPKAPSRVLTGEGGIQLNRFIEKSPDAVLGVAAARIYKNQLPFLFKVLAAAKPLSIQAHPNRDQARQGFAAENRRGVDISAAERNYRDANHKPECLCALTDFWAMNGFRESGEIASRLQTLCPAALGEILDRAFLPQDGTGNLRRLFENLLTLGPTACRRAIDEAFKNLKRIPDGDAAVSWIKSLQEQYPYDIGVLSPVFLNLVCLRPGQALFLPAGQLHAYLEGVGIELMANSDNVLRGGLTPKHVDVPELMRVLNFSPTRLDILAPVPVSPTEKVYRTPAREFELSVIEAKHGRPHTNHRCESVQILLCTAGRATLCRASAPEETISVNRGGCLLATAAAGAFQIEGQATLYKAAVPEKS